MVKSSKFSVCLTKYHVIKSNPLLNEAPSHEHVLGSGGKVPHINLSTRNE